MPRGLPKYVFSRISGPFTQISKEKFRQEFIAENKKLKEKIFKESYSKKIKGKKFNGSSLAVLIEDWVDSINKGILPNISTM